MPFVIESFIERFKMTALYFCWFWHETMQFDTMWNNLIQYDSQYDY